MKKDLSMFLLPNGFKAVGLAMAIMSLFFLVILMNTGDGIAFYLVRTFISGILLGLLIFVLSREKKEDETVKRVREISLITSFVSAVVIALLTPLLSLLPQRLTVNIGLQEIAFALLLVYILEFYLFNSRHPKQKHE
jgi:ABC-type polysaccharide transport system permease subunit